MTPKKTLVSKKRRLTRSSVDHEEPSSSTHVPTTTSTPTSTPQIPTPISNPTPTQIPTLTPQGSSTPTPNQIPTPTPQGSSTPTTQVPTTMGESNSDSDSDLRDNDELSLPNRKGRNLDHPEDHPKQGERYKIEWEPTHMQPTGHLRKKFNAMINRVAKMHTIFPLNVNWPKQTSQSFRQAFEYIEVDFDLDGYPNAHQYIKFKLNNTWRRYRNYIKEKYFDPFVDDESTERMYACLHLYIDRFTFEKCVEELWTIEEFKRKSKINKTNRTKKILNHKTGSIPFSAIRENLQREDIETSRINVLIRSSGTDNEVIVIQQKCISKFIQSKKGRHIRLGGGSFAESSTTSTRFSNEMNARFLEKEKGKKKEKMNDQMVMLLQDNQVLKMKHDEIVEMFEDMKKTFISQSNTTPQPSDRGSLQDKSNAGQSDQRYQTPPFK